MKKALATLAILTVAAVAARADTLTDWTFEGTASSTLTPSTDFTYGPADNGTQVGGSIGAGHHTSTATAWSSPSGNASPKSLSSDHWAVGDYWQFTLSTTNYSGLSVGWDQMGSNTGPRDFKLQYSTDGSSFTDAGTYSITNDSWATGGSPKTQSHYSFDLSAVTALDGQGSIFLRLVDNSTTSITGGTTATGGTDRVDNFTVSGTTAAIPEPSTIGMIGLGAAFLIGGLRYRKNRKS